MTRLPKPAPELGDTKQLLLGYLDLYRSIIATKLEGMSDAELRSTRLPSGWTPIQLLKHLVFMERRWLRWGFAAEQVSAPWGDNADADRDGPWSVGPRESLEELLAALHAGGESTRSIVAPADLGQPAGLGGRFAGDRPAPTLNWILFHVLQEYARHAGHLDIARELADGSVGE